MITKKHLPTLFAAMALQLSTSTEAQTTAFLNPNGLGQVLFYPYYTVNNELNTLFSVTNTTAKSKALKIKFLEGKNNRDTLIFNIYLGPYDVWTAGVVQTLSTINGHIGEDSSMLVTNDDSCTVPQFVRTEFGYLGQEFLPYAMEGDFADGMPANMNRVTEGQIQIFEMGELSGEFAQWADPNHSSFDCGSLNENWVPPAGIWNNDPLQNLSAPTGGLYGNAIVLDVQRGVEVSYQAHAINGYSNQVQHESPGTTLPDLSSGTANSSWVFTENQSNQYNWDRSVDAISSLFVASNVYADFVLSDNINADSESVMSFPTKSFYTDPLYSGSENAVAPFTSVFGADGACESVDVTLTSRDAVQQNSGLELCFGNNTVKFNQLNSNNSEITASNNQSIVNSNFEYGWVNFEFDQSLTANPNSGNTTSTLHGLPVTGFTIQRYVNSNLSGGVLANYAGLAPFKKDLDITASLTE